MRAFVIFRDRVSYARRCVAALRKAGLEPVIVDHGSTWPAAVLWLAELEEKGTLVLYRGGGHPRDMWGWGPFWEARGEERYVVTDPDVIPARGCPADWPEYLSKLLDRFPGVAKAGFGLRIDNLPAHYDRREKVIAWEQQWWADEMEPGLFRAPLDTTLALYRERSVFLMDAIRTGPPYVADHVAWHENPGRLPADITYYYEHAEQGISHWATGTPPAR